MLPVQMGPTQKAAKIRSDSPWQEFYGILTKAQSELSSNTAKDVVLGMKTAFLSLMRDTEKQGAHDLILELKAQFLSAVRDVEQGNGLTATLSDIERKLGREQKGQPDKNDEFLSSSNMESLAKEKETVSQETGEGKSSRKESRTSTVKGMLIASDGSYGREYEELNIVGPVDEVNRLLPKNARIKEIHIMASQQEGDWGLYGDYQDGVVSINPTELGGELDARYTAFHEAMHAFLLAGYEDKANSVKYLRYYQLIVNLDQAYEGLLGMAGLTKESADALLESGDEKKIDAVMGSRFMLLLDQSSYAKGESLASGYSFESSDELFANVATIFRYFGKEFAERLVALRSEDKEGYGAAMEVALAVYAIIGNLDAKKPLVSGEVREILESVAAKR